MTNRAMTEQEKDFIKLCKRTGLFSVFDRNGNKGRTNIFLSDVIEIEIEDEYFSLSLKGQIEFEVKSNGRIVMAHHYFDILKLEAKIDSPITKALVRLCDSGNALYIPDFIETNPALRKEILKKFKKKGNEFLENEVKPFREYLKSGLATERFLKKVCYNPS